ncbi:thymidylate synthase [Podophage Lau218]|uniref:Thymidylate synthase ThyX n=2 Tax=Lauvirus lau218 TaxID=1465639 RepID=A0A060BKW6_9CAUD|nr:thymidylate synthase [Podophage Lau218]AIA83144.1 thymidylate synthase ThyX [Podophage Lau218]AIA83192.1 thymidylate synthase ThyX [Lauvirus lau218]AIA83242.1 thymidylate synthase ThyX [Lauvirus lau218]
MKVELIDHMGSDLTVANSARVSFNKQKKEFEDKDKGLLKYLAEHNHWTPFAHPQITLRVKAPISIRTQCFKHKIGFTENEISRRYVSDNPQFFKPTWREAPVDGAKQGSGDIIKNPKYLDLDYDDFCFKSKELYQSLLDSGVAPEQARFVLPQGMMTEWYWTGSLSAFARFYKQRTHKGAQSEIRELADMIGSTIAPLFPVSWEVLT